MMTTSSSFPSFYVHQGLTAVSRTISGNEADFSSYLELLKMQMETGGEDGGPDQELCDRVQASGLDLEGYARGCNAHLVTDGRSQPAINTVYCDINRYINAFIWLPSS